MGDSSDRARRRLESEFLLALRGAGAVMQLLGAASAERIGINVTDLNCLNILALTGRMTAGELARATGLTTASITGVLDRLEEAGPARPAASGRRAQRRTRAARRRPGIRPGHRGLACRRGPVHRRAAHSHPRFPAPTGAAHARPPHRAPRRHLQLKSVIADHFPCPSTENDPLSHDATQRRDWAHPVFALSSTERHPLVTLCRWTIP
jgi:DNA-binding MarR family transcriptional regulator